MAINVTVTPIVQDVEVSANVTPYEVQVEVLGGPQGPAGPQGPQGEKGDKGDKGDQGDPGSSTSVGSPANGLNITNQVLTIGLASGSTNGALSSTDWSTFNNKGDLSSSGSYSNPTWITSLDWGKIANEPTTLGGYGITDGTYSKIQALGSISGNQTINLSNGVLITATLTNAVTLAFTGLPTAGNEIAFSLRFAGIFQITFPVGTKFANDIAPTLEAPLYELPCSIDSAGNVIVYGAINKIDTI